MVLIYIVIAILTLWGMQLRRPADTSAALTVDQSTIIKGIFVLLVFASHIGQYLTLPDGIMTRSYQFVRSNLGQLTVVPFLFFSGYGVRCSVMHKGNAYIRSMPKKRLLRTYTQTAVILLLFLTVQLTLGHRYSLGQILWAFSLLGSFGNSNWYLFAILYLYTATWLSFRLIRAPKRACLACFLLSSVYFIGFSIWKEHWWYDTVFAYSFGLIFPDIQSAFGKIVKRTSGWLAACAALTAIVLVLTKLSYPHVIDGVVGNVRAICFMMLILAFLSRFQVGNCVLRWLGSHVFLCYLLQRLPMIVLHHFDVSKTCVPLFVIGSAAGTVLIVLLFSKVMSGLDHSILRESTKEKKTVEVS